MTQTGSDGMLSHEYITSTTVTYRSIDGMVQLGMAGSSSNTALNFHSQRTHGDGGVLKFSRPIFS